MTPSNEWDAESNNVDDGQHFRIHHNAPTELDTSEWGRFNDASASDTTIGSSFIATSDINLVDRGNIPVRINGAHLERVGITCDFRGSTWEYTLKYMASWFLAPAFMLISKLFNKEISFRSRMR